MLDVVHTTTTLASNPATPGGVPLYSVYIILGVISLALGSGAVIAKWVRGFTKERREHEQRFLEVSQAIAGVPGTRFSPPQKGLVEQVSDLTKLVTELTKEVNNLHRRIEKLEERVS